MTERDEALDALKALVRFLSENHGKFPTLALPMELHAQIRRVMGDDFYRPVRGSTETVAKDHA